MKLERLHESVNAAVALVIGLLFAIVCGYWLANDEQKLVFGLLGSVAVVAFLLFAREYVWMLIPGLMGLSGKVVALPLPFTVGQLGILVAFGMILILKALKVVRIKPKLGIVEIWMLIMLGYLAVTYLRNPVGTEAFGSDRVGGKPYVDVFIACLAYWVLARSVAGSRGAIFLPLLGLVGTCLHTLLNFIAYHFPSTIGPLANLYGGIAAAENLEAGPVLPEEGGRLAYLQSVGGGFCGAACSYWRPLTVINPLHFWRFVVFGLGIIAVLLSGFRSNLMGVMEVFLLSSYFRRGWREVLWVGAMGIAGVIFLVVLQGNVLELPLPAQRTLSFLPGKWEYAAKAEAEGSTEWRITMWKAMLTEDKYIENKWLGDGFGFTHHQLEIMTANATSGNYEDQQENFMITGGVHSGPISTIRYVGYVGLAIFLVFLVLLAIRSFRLIRRAQRTPFFPYALALGMGSVLLPFNFIFIFGAFEGDLPSAIIAAGFQKLLENSLEAYEAGLKKAAPEVIQPPKMRPNRRLAPAGRVA